MNNVFVAKLGKTVGLQGEMKIFIESDFPGQFKQGVSFTTDKNITLEIASFNENRGTVRFTTINSVEEAKKLTNSQLFSSYEETRDNCKLNDKQFFWFDIEKCTIIEDNLELGKVVEIHRYPTSDYLEIKTSDELIEKGLTKTFLIPYIDDYIVSVDIETKTIQTKEALLILENS